VSHSHPIEVGDCDWYPEQRRLLVRGAEVKLPHRALECWAALVDAQGQTLSREQLVERIWGGALMEGSNLPQTIATLRRAIDPPPSGESYIETIPRIGYRLVPGF
jgi:DNA-binding winged helix-turn-helix (wHTH) protein